MGKLNSVARNINDFAANKRSCKRETSVTELFKKNNDYLQPEMPKSSLKASSSSNNGFSPINADRCGKLDSFTRKIMADDTPGFNPDKLSESGTPRLLPVQSQKLNDQRGNTARQAEGLTNFTVNVINQSNNYAKPAGVYANKQVQTTSVLPNLSGALN